MKTSHLYAVILAGGSGTRFWPMSRERFPKQFLQINGADTLLQQTIRRVLKCVPARQTVVVTNVGLADAMRIQVDPWREDLAENLIFEPIGRNTAPAIGLAALWLARRDPQAVMLTLPADHIIQDDRQFTRAVTFARRLATDGYLVTFGVKATRPETGYGYIQPNLRSAVTRDKTWVGYRVLRFIEKPNLSRAQQYVRKKTFLWNSGIFLWKVDVILDELQRHQPRLFRQLRKIEQMFHGRQPNASILREYQKLKSVSIDYGVMERSNRAAVVPVSFRWSDVGSWASLCDVSPMDKQGNVTVGNVVDVQCRDSILFGNRRLVAGVGLTDMVVVDTPDATLVCPKSRSQDVKKLVDVLKQRGLPERVEHLTVHRPWGSYTVIEEGKGYKVKRITVKTQGRLSLQMHYQRSEHWVVIGGTARVTRGCDVFDLRPGQSTDIPPQTQHRLENPGKIPLEIIEVQNGPYLGEDDIVRFQDDYGRQGGRAPLVAKGHMK